MSPPSEEGSSVESFVEVDGNTSSSLEAPKQSLQMGEDEMVRVYFRSPEIIQTFLFLLKGFLNQSHKEPAFVVCIASAWV